MQYSLRSLLIVVGIVGCLPTLIGNFWVPFGCVLFVSIVLALREFESDVDSQPPNFS
jgi:hypothetical protein